MRKRLMLHSLAAIVLMSWLPLNLLIAQEKTDKADLKVAADLVSGYIWRGGLVDATPNFQPTLSVKKWGLEAGAWGSTNYSGSYKEVDLFVYYTCKNLKAYFNDYLWTPFIFNTNYLEFTDKTSGHILEGGLGYKFSEKFPLSLSVYTMFHGADKGIDKIDMVTGDTTYKNLYSTYIEGTYSFKVNGNSVDAFIGFTPDKGLYGTSMGVVNLGFTGYRDIRFSETFSLPVKVTFMVNPQVNKAYLVFGITF